MINISSISISNYSFANGIIIRSLNQLYSFQLYSLHGSYFQFFHQIFQSCIFTDIFKCVKTTLNLPQLGIIVETLITFVLCPVVELTLISWFRVGHNPTRLQLVNKAVMLIYCIKRLFIVRLFIKKDHLSPDDHYFLIFCNLSQV